MRPWALALWIGLGTLGCDREPPSPETANTVRVQTIEEWEAEEAKRTTPVRDSADAVARAFAAIDWQGNRGDKTVRTVTRDSAGYLVTVDIGGPYYPVSGLRVLIKPNGVAYFIADVD